MKQSKLILISIFITAAILVIVGGVGAQVLASKNTVQADDSQTVQAYQQREQEYNQLIEQANQQLEQANSQLQALQEQAAQQPQPDTAAAAALSAEQAGEIASQAAELGQFMLATPALVEYEGKVAYEVAFEKGDIYVDAQSGEVLYNGTVPQEITAFQAVEVASNYLNDTDVLQVDEINTATRSLFRVIFKDGTIVFMDKMGQITEIIPYQPAVKQQASTGTNGGSSDSHASRDDDDHHEDEDEDD